MTNESNDNQETPKQAKKYVVRTSKRYQDVDGNTVNTYITLGGKRVYVLAKEGEKITADEAK